MNRTSKTAVRTACSPEFFNWFRAILYNRQLTWGAKCLAFSILDIPPTKKIKLSALARKLGTNTATINQWKKQLLALKFFFLENNPEAI